MSINTLLFNNSLNLNGSTIQLNGRALNGAFTQPVITDSNVYCPNLYVERSRYCDTIGNVFPFNILNAPQVDWVLTGVTPTTAEWSELPTQEAARYLQTDTTTVKIFSSVAPSAGYVLVALSSTEAEWGPQAGAGSNIAAFLETTGAPVDVKSSAPPLVNQVLKATSSTTAEWSNVIATNAVNAIHADWADTANVFTGKALDSFHADWADTANVAVNATNSLHSVWSDYANALPTTTTFVNVSNATEPVNGAVLTAVSNVAALWIVPTVLPAALVAVEKKFNGSLYLTGVTTNANTNQTIFINEARFDNTTESLSINGSYVSDKTTNQLVLGTTPNTTTINSVAPSSSRVVTLNDPGSDSSLVTDTGGALNISNTGTNNYVLTATGANAANWAAPAASSTVNVTLDNGPTIHYFTVMDTASTGAKSLETVSQIWTNQSGNSIHADGGFYTSINGAVYSQATTNQLILGSLLGNYTTISATAPASSRTLTIHDPLAAANFVLDSGGAMTITDAPAGANEVLISTSTTAATWQTSLPTGLQPNLTGPITSVGVATSVAAQTGTGSTFVMQTTPTLTTPIIGVATGTSLDVSGALQGATVTADATTNQLVLGTTNTTTISATTPASSRTLTIHDPLAAANFVLDSGGALTITDVPAGANEVLISTSTTAATWQTSLPTGLQPNLTGPIQSTGVATKFSGATTATAAGTTTLTSASEYVQIFTGSTTQTVKLPSPVLGMCFIVINRSSGTLTVNANDNSLVDTLSVVGAANYVCAGVVGTNADWFKF